MIRPSEQPSSAPSAIQIRGAGTDRVEVDIEDEVGDVVVRSGALRDTDNSPRGFKPGAGSRVASTPADRAVDLIRVSYQILLGEPIPVLRVAYRVAGAFSFDDQTTETATDMTRTMASDSLSTELDGGYSIQMQSDGRVSHSGLFHTADQRRLRCAGIESSMKVGASEATQTVPLSCLAAIGVTESTLRASSNHAVVTGMASTDGMHGDHVTLAADLSATTPRLPLTLPAR